MTWLQWTGRYGLGARDIVLSAVVALAAAAALTIWTGPLAACFTAVLIFSMLLVMVSDSRRMLIPDILSLPAIPAGLAAAMTCLPGRWQDNLGGHAIAAVLAAAALYTLRWIYLKLRGRIGLGMGDVKLAAVAGSWVGLDLLPLTLLLASVAALVSALLASRRSGSGRLQPGTAVPFGSFIAPAIVIGWVFRLLSEF